MDHELLSTISTISARLEQVIFAINNIQQQLSKQRNEELLKRLDALEALSKKQSLKLDALNAIEPLTVVNNVSKVVSTNNDSSTPSATTAETTNNLGSKPKTFTTITEFFKYMYSNNPQELYSKGIINEAEVTELINKNQAVLAEKKTDVIRLRAIVTLVYKSLTKESKQVLQALKLAYTNDCTKQNAVELKTEDEIND